MSLMSPDMLHPLTKLILERRGIVDPEEVARFVAPDYERDTYDPFLILNMERAVDRILRAFREGEKIVIYGDYDCDGIPGSVILHDLFHKIGIANFSNYIPHRHHEGYGLNANAVARFAKEGVTLLITVDCGITDVDEVALAERLGIDVIVTDHHLTGPVLPPAYAILNSKQEGDTYPDHMLCGAGVAWKLAHAILMRGNYPHIPAGWEKWLLDMAGLSTIADMVPLRNENRTLAYFGLKVLRKSPRAGLHALLREAGVEQRYLNEEDVGFTIGPRINAASRMDVPMRAFELLAERDPKVAAERARYLDTLNTERKGEVARMMKEARKTLSARELREVIVIGNPRWRVGVAGIVAGQLAEAFDRPAFVWGREGAEMVKGSCRSDGRVNIVELMHAVGEGVFIDRGGHEFSGGFSLAMEQVHFLESALVKAHATLSKKERTHDDLVVDSELRLSDVNDEIFAAIDLLAPFGVENPRPIFAFPRVRIARVALFGKGKEHLRLTLTDDDGEETSAIGFFMTPDSFPNVSLEAGTRVTLIAVMERSYFRGRPELRLRIKDIRSA